MYNFPTLEKYLSFSLKNIPLELFDENIYIGDQVEKGISLLSDKNQRLFACDCGERALQQEQQKTNNSPDVIYWQTIKIARQYTYGKATSEDLFVIRTTVYASWHNLNFALKSAASTTVSISRNAAIWAATFAAINTIDTAANAHNDAKDTAYFAERKWQLNKIIKYLEKERT